jgi:hypothetical protein
VSDQLHAPAHLTPGKSRRYELNGGYVGPRCGADRPDYTDRYVQSDAGGTEHPANVQCSVSV